MANRTTTGASHGVESFVRVRGDVERATRSVALLGRPLSAHSSRIRWEEVLSPTRNDLGQAQQAKGALGDWSKKLKVLERALFSQHLDFTTVEKDFAFAAFGTYGALSLMGKLLSLGKSMGEAGFPNLAFIFKAIGKLGGTPFEWATGAILRAIGVAPTAVPMEAEGAEAVVGLAPEVATAVLAGAAVGIAGTGIYYFGIKGSRLEGWLASHLHDEKSNVHLRKREEGRHGTNTWHVTHAPQITVVVGGVDAAHPRKIAEQMVMALQAHHSELDQKLADAWKRQAVRDERTGF